MILFMMNQVAPFPITEESFKNPLLDAYVNTEFRKILNFEIAQGLKVGVIKKVQTKDLKTYHLIKKLLKDVLIMNQMQQYLFLLIIY